MKKIIFLALGLIILASFNYSVYQKEQVKAHGKTIYLKLAPVDPRSLMQGDYMQLRYDIEQNTTVPLEKIKHAHFDVIVSTDEQGMGRRIQPLTQAPLKTNEYQFHARKKWGQIHLVPDTFFFQEGHARLYAKARYGIFKFLGKQYLLVGLADESLSTIETINPTDSLEH